MFPLLCQQLFGRTTEIPVTKLHAETEQQTTRGNQQRQRGGRHEFRLQQLRSFSIVTFGNSEFLFLPRDIST